MPFCPDCGTETGETDRYCPKCGALLDREEKVQAQKTDALVALQKGIHIISAQPSVLIPVLLGAVISAILSAIPRWWVAASSWWRYISPGIADLLVISLLLTLLGLFFSYILIFVSLDMARDAYLDQELNFTKSLKYVFSRFLTFIVASIIGAVFSVTIILIPVAILMFVILVLDETGIGNAIFNSFKVLGDRLVDIIVLVVIAIIGGLVLGLVPIVGSFLTAAFNVLVGLAFIDVYSNYKMTKT